MTADRLALAKGYPYRIPTASFVYVDGRAVPYDGLDRLDRLGRIPVIGYGSNRSPEQLARKFAGWPEGTVVPVTLARLADHDIVYGAQFTAYGAVPAVLARRPGTAVTVSVTWLTEAQLTRMHATEGAANYRFARLDGIALEAEGVGRVESAFAYLGRRGALAGPDGPIALAAVAAENRAGPAEDQEAVLARARDRLAPDAALDPFILQNVSCPVTRRQRTERLTGDAVPTGR
ncbi:MAG: hypothetical protein RID91_22075 [Azospirillaceae bacterium]